MSQYTRWPVISGGGGGGGDVVGPGSSTNFGIAVFDGTDGKLIQSTTFLIDGDGLTATNDVFPDADNTSELGLDGSRWSKGHFAITYTDILSEDESAGTGLSIITQDDGAGSSGPISIITGAAANPAARGDIELDAYQVLLTSGGATQISAGGDLNIVADDMFTTGNISPTDDDNGNKLGASDLRWSEIWGAASYAYNFNLIDIDAGLATAGILEASATTGVALSASDAESPITVFTADNSGGDTGDINLTCGAASDEQGSVRIEAKNLYLNGSKVFPPGNISVRTLMDEDFIGGFYGSGIVGSNVTLHAQSNYAGAVSGYRDAPTISTAGNPGVIELYTNGLNADDWSLMDNMGGGGKPLKIGAGETVFSTIVKISNLSTGGERYSLYVGIVDQPDSAVTCTNGIYWTYSDNANSGNWVAYCSNGGTDTALNTSIAPSTTAFQRLSWVLNAAGTSVEFFIDGVSQGTTALTIPANTTSMRMFWHIVKSVGMAAVSLYVDAFRFSVEFNTPR